MQRSLYKVSDTGEDVDTRPGIIRPCRDFFKFKIVFHLLFLSLKRLLNNELRREKTDEAFSIIVNITDLRRHIEVLNVTNENIDVKILRILLTATPWGDGC